MPFEPPLPDELTANGWHLRVLTISDWPLEHEMSRDPEVVRWTLYPPNLSETEARLRIERAGEHQAAGRGARYAVLDATGAAVGTAGILCSVGDPMEAEVFYALLARGRHQGAALAAARTLTDQALSSGMRRVFLLTVVGNDASEAVARRLRFNLAGEEVQDHKGAPTRMRRWVT